MKKLKALIGKKQIILASLVVGLGLAVYVNYQFAQADNMLTLTSALEGGKNYGDAQLVDATDLFDSEAYFAEAKMSRQLARDESIETFNTMLSNAEVDPNLKAEMALQAAAFAQAIETEGKIENLIKAKGYNECMVYYDTENVDVVIKTEGLEATDVTVMKDIILKETNIPVENISIVEIN